jgi:hypothetical protein
MKRFDWTVYEGSRIKNMHKLIQPAALLVRNLSPKDLIYSPSPPHNFDGMATFHNDSFRHNPRFRKAYTRAVAAAGWDYKIPYRIHQALWCSRQAQKVDGDFVELGTGRGFIMSAVLASFQNWESCSRTLHLFDTFISTALDEQGRQSLKGTISPRYAKSIDDVKINFSEWKRVMLHQGDVFDTLQELDSSRISMLHIDMNDHRPEVYGLRTLWKKIPRGGVVLLDDYAYRGYEQTYKAMNDLAEELGFDILSTATGQGIIIK